MVQWSSFLINFILVTLNIKWEHKFAKDSKFQSIAAVLAKFHYWVYTPKNQKQGLKQMYLRILFMATLSEYLNDRSNLDVHDKLMIKQMWRRQWDVSALKREVILTTLQNGWIQTTLNLSLLQQDKYFRSHLLEVDRVIKLKEGLGNGGMKSHCFVTEQEWKFGWMKR